MKTVSRLDVLAMKILKTLMKDDDVALQQTVKSVLQNVQSAHHQRVLSQKQTSFNFLLLRFIHLRLIVSLLSLLEHEPDSLVELHFHWHSPLEITTPSVDNRRVFMINEEDVFWNKNDVARYLINLFLVQFPRSITVYRGSIPLNEVPIHTFVRAVDDAFEIPPHQERKWHRLYNQHYLKHFA